MEKKTMHITFHNPNSPEKTVQFLLKMLARTAVERRRGKTRGEGP